MIQLIQGLFTLKDEKYLSGLQRYVNLYGPRIHIGIFLLATTVFICTSPLTCLNAKDSALSDRYTEAKCANGALLRVDLKLRSEMSTEKPRQAKKSRGNTKETNKTLESQDNSESNKLVSYYR